jgi:catechol 2,3-dioxygenase-like lactoylglutathione lyase family enzyme
MARGGLALMLTLGLAAPLATARPAHAAGVPRLQLAPFMIGLSVADLDKVTAWYVDKLDFRVTKDVPLGQDGGRLRFIESGSQRIELLFVPGARPGPTRALPPAHGAVRGFTHLTMEVADLDAALAILAARDIKPEVGPVPIPQLGVRVIFLRDPEGNMVEILQRLKN